MTNHLSQMNHAYKREVTLGKQSAMRGVAAIEFAFVLMMLLAVVTGMIELGRSFWYYDALTKATRDGARLLSNARFSSTVAIDATLRAQAKDLVFNAASLAHVPNFTTNDVSVTCDPNCDNPIYVSVAINAYPLTIGGWIPVIIPAGTAAWGVTFSPYVTMRYMD